MRALATLGLLAVLATPSSVTPSGSMSSPRAAHSATLLASGEVFIAGGCAIDSCEMDARGATTELFDPATGRFRAGPRLLRPRVSHSALRLPDGRVLIAGGWLGGRPTASTELFDPRQNAVAAGPSMTTARGGFAVAPLGRGRFLFTGGTNGSRIVRTAEIFDATTGRFRRTGEMRSPRAIHVATLMRGGRVLLTGGEARDLVLSSTEIYDARRGRFLRGPSLTVNRYKHAAVPLRDGGVLVVGGSDGRDFNGRYASVERLAPGAARFARAGRMAEARFKLPDAVVRLPSGRVVIAGGGSRVELYDPRTRRVRSLGRIGASFAFSTATMLRDGRVLVAGGYDDRLRVSRAAWIVAP